MSNNHHKAKLQPKGLIIRQVGGHTTYINNAKVDITASAIIVVEYDKPDRTRMFPMHTTLEVDMPGTFNLQQGKIIKPSV